MKNKKVIIRPRHKVAIKKMLENVGTDKKALEGLNYKEGYIKSGNIKNTKSWKAVSEEILPNELLAKVNLGLLKHKSWQARSSGLDKAYKAKKIYSNAVEITNKYSGLSDQELRERFAGIIAGSIRHTIGIRKKRRGK